MTVHHNPPLGSISAEWDLNHRHLAQTLKRLAICAVAFLNMRITKYHMVLGFNLSHASNVTAQF